jgi:hypothetical protein
MGRKGKDAGRLECVEEISLAEYESGYVNEKRLARASLFISFVIASCVFGGEAIACQARLGSVALPLFDHGD